MTYELATISLHDLHSVTGGGGRFDAMMLEKQQKQQPKKPTSSSKGPSELGNICRDAYAGTGAFIGGGLTSETLGWGAIPGAIVGGIVGRAVCPP